ncbi:class I SAM-dependent methyltransferase [Bryobacter aggregatus]|uniref:class I SAM-dependent methyltransferase n=1 Tax=Bryobacter aggregatus TaxID=360054 RepID=UPI00068B1E94|nr:class I SAM-dependent methyltransferase [Bryobacter aggregatus]
MSNPFGTEEMAAGYANSRPAVHPLVMAKAYQALGRPRPFYRALDVGCGAGVSTRALGGLAEHRIGMEPAEAMLRWTSSVAPSADFLVGTAESIPVADRCVDLISAAGSLNYVKLVPFFEEAARVLAPTGVLVAYDFSPGRSFRHSDRLDQWFGDFVNRYPWPLSEARTLSPEILGGLDFGFQLQKAEVFEIGVRLDPAFYLNYMLTETNVAAAVRRGVELDSIRQWCSETLAPVWDHKPHEVLFRGYYACLTALPS